MDEIKFKAYNKIIGEMYVPDAYWKLEFDHKHRWFVWRGDTLFVNHLNGVLIQFTGVYDKNHNPIYCGDFLKDDLRRIWLVSYSNTYGGWVAIGDEFEETLLNHQFDEIIGNHFKDEDLYA